MTLARRLNRFLDRLRAPEAFEAAARPGSANASMGFAATSTACSSVSGNRASRSRFRSGLAWSATARTSTRVTATPS
jgi:hypothetical protein